jgi:hypothetical protein
MSVRESRAPGDGSCGRGLRETDPDAEPADRRYRLELLAGVLDVFNSVRIPVFKSGQIWRGERCIQDEQV